MRRIWLIIVAVILIALAACTSQPAPAPPPPTPGTASAGPITRPSPSSASTEPAATTPAPSPSGSLQPVHDPGQVTGTLTGPCRTRDNNQLPDPRCTPGSYDPAVTQENLASTVCVKHISRKTGKITYDLSDAWRAGRPPVAQTNHAKFFIVDPAYGIKIPGELDHLVAREIGGSNDLSNLWLEAGPIPNPKDLVENAAHDAVCSGQITLAYAQVAIAVNWVQLGQQLGTTPKPVVSMAPPHSAPAAVITHAPRRTYSAAPPPPVFSPTTPSAPRAASCYPLTNGGHCYEPGEFCRKADAGSSGMAGDGKRIVCTNGHWELA